MQLEYEYASSGYELVVVLPRDYIAFDADFAQRALDKGIIATVYCEARINGN